MRPTTTRSADRDRLVESIITIARRRGALAAHLLGSLGRETADDLSDIDIWLTFAGDAVEGVVRDRFALCRGVGDLLLAHEAPANRPLGGIYTLALYAGPSGPHQVDWYLAPSRTSRVAPDATTIFEHRPIARGPWVLDHDAEDAAPPAGAVSWLISMLFVAIKQVVRGLGSPFPAFLGEAYRHAFAQHNWGEPPPAEPTSFAAIGALLQGLSPHAEAEQRRALAAVDAFRQGFEEDAPSPFGRGQERPSQP
jgi:hypothetical protein